MKKYRFFSFLLALLLFTSLLPCSTGAIEDINIDAPIALLMDANYDEVLYTKNADVKAAPASITKVMTALLTVEAIERGELSLNTIVTASEEAAAIPYGSSTSNIVAGEQMTVEDLLYCLMLPSANEAAQILGEAVSGSIPAFVDLMNQRARELGCHSTHFVNAHGFDEEGHYTTARDIYIFSKEAFKHDIFQTVVYTSVHKVPATNKSKEREMYNSNALVSQWRYPGYRYDKVIGGKTGSTGDAGLCLMAAAKNGDDYLISVVLGAELIRDDRGNVVDRKQFSESRRLLVWGFKSFKRVTLSQDDKPVASMPVTLSQQTDTVMLQSQGSITRTLPVDLDEGQLEYNTALFYESIQAPVEEGQILGTMTISYEGEVLGTMDLVACTSVERSEFLYQKDRIEQFFKKSGTQIALAGVSLLAGLVCLRLLVFRKRRRPYSSTGARRNSGQNRNVRRDDRW